ncbi:MAG: hypothetical protein H6745_32975 [Deltaproteobacteria bacterium]|nr:hypothetical protein [Deltaproteobacteria bacterium]
MSGARESGAAPEPEPGPERGQETPPPFLGRWRNVYLALLIAQAVVIGGLALLTALASR